jgi:hypothetical protein
MDGDANASGLLDVLATADHNVYLPNWADRSRQRHVGD